jgi:plasmid stability protein
VIEAPDAPGWLGFRASGSDADGNRVSDEPASARHHNMITDRIQFAALTALCASIMLAGEPDMATLTIRNVRPAVVKSLKALARRSQRSMEQQVRELLEDYVAERRSVLEQIEAGWAAQPRRPTAEQVDNWIGAGRK